jgi:hypothetical protein
MTSDFDYKKYSLEQLETWVHDAVSGDASPQEIFDVIKGVVDEQYHYHKHNTGRCYELLALLNGNGRGHIQAYDEYKGSSVSSVESPVGKESSQWTYKGKPATYDEIVADGWEMTADGFWWREPKKYKVKKWVLPVEETTNAQTGLEEYFVTFPNDLLYMTNLKEGDQIEWVDQGDGSYLLRKVTKTIGMEEC